MSETYQLLYQGEVQEGQHPSVVRKRLGDAGFSEEQLDRLFSGRVVVLKRAADAATTARYQALFKKAGASLRVAPGAAPDGASPQPARPPEAATAQAASGFEVLPVGSDLLRAEERAAAPPAAPDVSHLSLAERGADLGPRDRGPAPPPPDVSHLSVVAEPDATPSGDVSLR